MKKTIFLIIIFFMICTMNVSSTDFSAYTPIEYADFIKFFELHGNDLAPGLTIFGNTALRVHAILHEFPRKLDSDDIDNIRSTLRSLGFHPDNASHFAYKIEYVLASTVDWREETRLVFYIQNVQRQYFEKEYRLNDTIYWFIVFSQFSTFTQRGYFLVSDFINEEQFIRYGLK